MRGSAGVSRGPQALRVRFPDGLDNQRNRAAGGIGIDEGEGDPFPVFHRADHHEITRLSFFGDEGRVDFKFCDRLGKEAPGHDREHRGCFRTGRHVIVDLILFRLLYIQRRNCNHYARRSVHRRQKIYPNGMKWGLFRDGDVLTRLRFSALRVAARTGYRK